MLGSITVDTGETSCESGLLRPNAARTGDRADDVILPELTFSSAPADRMRLMTLECDDTTTSGVNGGRSASGEVMNIGAEWG